jgi:hypothetical protein
MGDFKALLSMKDLVHYPIAGQIPLIALMRV